MRKSLQILTSIKKTQFFTKMATVKGEKWIFSREKLQDTPSRKAGIDTEKELSYRQQAANLIQDMGQRLSVNQLTINTAIVYMHRFYVYHSFTVFSRYAIAPTALFLAAKVEEQPKKLQHVLQICHACLHPDKPNLDTHSDSYMKQAQELVQNELALLQSLGFEISVDHPHTHVVKCTQLVKASRDLSQMAYFMATNSLHLTTFCLVYKPTVVAAMCIHLSCKWSNYEIPLSSDGKHYWSYMDPSISEPLLDTIITEFLKILNRCPTRLRKLKNYRPSQNAKDGQDVMEDFKNYQHTSSSYQSSSQPVKKPVNPPSQPPANAPVKEKKQTLSIEEYKKAQAAKTQSKPPPPHQRPLPNHSSQLPSTSSQVKKVDSSNPPRPADTHHSKPVSNTHLTKPARPAADINDAIHKNMMRPSYTQHSKSSDPQRRPHDKSHHSQQRSTADEKAMDGRVPADKIQKQHPNDSHRSTQLQSTNRVVHDRPHVDKSRAPESQTHSSKSKQLDSKQIAELYHKNPEKLRHYLKMKAQTVRLSNEEKGLYMKLQAKEEERRKRKAAELAKQKERKSSEEVSSVESPGPLTLRIKLGPKPDPSKQSSVAKIIAPESESQSPSSVRKRHHEGQSGHPSASKHAKKSDRNKHHHNHGRSGSSSGGEGRHRHSHHKHASSNPKPVIDEAVFQKSLSDAMNNVQQQQQSVVPTVTLKRASNGKESSYFMTIPSSRHGFDPAAPVSAEVPDDIFEEEDPTQHAADINQAPNSIGSTEDSSAEVSTPESGEIKESPHHDKSKRNRRSNKVSSLFSPDARADSQLMRSSSGYHSGSQDADFPPPALLQKH